MNCNRKGLILHTLSILAMAAVSSSFRTQAMSQRPPGLSGQLKPLLAKMASLNMPLPTSTKKRLIECAAKHRDKQIDATLRRYTLVDIQITPESRVKVVRGPSSATLVQNEPSVFLVRVSNEAGVTSPLSISGLGVAAARTPGATTSSQWLQALVGTVRGMGPAPNLCGEPLEYVLLRLKTNQSGMREATLTFDVGQGTQDLGFRSETSILFKCHPAKPMAAPRKQIQLD